MIKIDVQNLPLLNRPSRAYFNQLLRAVPARNAFLRNEMRVGVLRSKCPKSGKMKGKNSPVRPFTGLSCPFFGYIARMPLFSRINLAKYHIYVEN